MGGLFEGVSLICSLADILIHYKSIVLHKGVEDGGTHGKITF